MKTNWLQNGCVKSLTLKEIPPKLHKALKERASRSGRSLNREAIAILSEAVLTNQVDVETMLDEIRRVRESLPGELTDTLLQEGIDRGRA